MRDFVITTENTADFPVDYIIKNDLGIVNLSYLIDGENFSDGRELEPEEFYMRVRAGSMPTTSQVNPDQAKEFFSKYLAKGVDILHLAFSSGLSGTYNSMRLAAEELMEEHKDCRIIVIDTLCASLGEGLIVDYALRMKAEGCSIEEIAAWSEVHKKNFIHVFTVDDLNHLYRGGRVSKATAVIGTMVNIKPILHVDNEGHLMALDKVRGRKKSLQMLVQYMDQKMGSYKEKNAVVFISHGDCLEDAEYVKKLIEEKYGEKEFLIHFIGPTIGTHAGPGTVALFFMGDER